MFWKERKVVGGGGGGGGVVQLNMNNLILWNPYIVGLLELYITSHVTCPLRK